MADVKILALLDLSSSHGRGVWNGMCQFARQFKGVEIVRSVRDEQLFEDFYAGVVCHVARPNLVEILKNAHKPVVNVSNRYADSAYPQVLTDEREVGRAAFRHFQEMGHRRFVFYGIPGHNYSTERGAGMRDAAEEAGCPFYSTPAGPDEVASLNRMEAFVDRLAKLPKPMAALACNDTSARRLANMCAERSIRVPQDLAILGVDNDQLVCEASDPLLSSVELNTEAIGYEAARMVMGLLEKKTMAQRVLVAHKGIVVRQSSGELAVDDAEVREVVAWIREGVSRGVRVVDVLRQFPMSRRSLEMRFQKSLGTSPSELIRRERVQLAGRLLAESQTPIKEIAFKCGFTDPRQFSKVFKRMMKKSPSEYREGQDVHAGEG